MIARALAPDPPILLLDEPLSALDAQLRDELKDVIADVQKRTRKTMMMVTHDQREALSLADSVIVMDLGHIAQMGSPADVYRHPATAFVASFVGNTNLVPGTVAAVQPDQRMTVRALGQELEVRSQDGLGPGDPVLLSLRPDDLEVIEETGSLELPVRLPRSGPQRRLHRRDPPDGGRRRRRGAAGPRRGTITLLADAGRTRDGHHRHQRARAIPGSA